MRFRLAKICDLNDIVDIHYNIRETYSIGIFAKLGKPFLREYYKIVLCDKNGVIICAEDEYGKIHGFCSATLNVEEQFENLRKNRLKLGISAIGSLIRNPSLIKQLFDRYRSMDKNTNAKIVNVKGARSEFWAWSANSDDSFSSLEMHEVLLNLLRVLGVVDLFFEVDTNNKKVFLFHKFNGAEVLDKIYLPDGRERALMKYNLIIRKSRLKI
jgi:hypothetical protein